MNISYCSSLAKIFTLVYNCTRYLDTNFLTPPLTYAAGGLMMTCEQVETCSLHDPINDGCADVN